jgi:hypothetical protein
MSKARFRRLGLPSAFFLVCTLFDFGLLATALVLKTFLCRGGSFMDCG